MHHHSSISKFPIPSMGRRVYSPKSMVNFYGIHVCKYTSSHGWYGWWFRNPTPVDMVNIRLFTGFAHVCTGFRNHQWVSFPWLNLHLDKPSTWRPKRFWRTREEQQWRGKPQRGWAPTWNNSFFQPLFSKNVTVERIQGPKREAKDHVPTNFQVYTPND